MKLLNITLLIFSSFLFVNLATCIVWRIKVKYLYICRQLSVFANNASKICSIRLKLSCLMTLTYFLTLWFLDTCPCFFKLLFCLHSKKCEPQQIYKKASLLLRTNIFFLCFWHVNFEIVWCIKIQTHLFMYLSSILSFSK